MGSWCSGLRKVPDSQNFGQKLFFFRVAKLFQAVVEGASRFHVDSFNSNMVKEKKKKFKKD